MSAPLQLIVVCILIQVLILVYHLTGPPKSLSRFTRTSSHTAPDFSHLAEHCAHIPPIPAASFLERQQSLAQTLHSLNASAYIAEPGASAGYFANLSGSQWHLSERPLLLIISPEINSGEQVHAKVSILTPAFELTRAKLLPLPSSLDIAYLAWPEDANPFAVAVSAIPSLSEGTVFVDGMARNFIVDGLQKATPGSEVVVSPVEIRRLRERKSKEELEIMKCVNEVHCLSGTVSSCRREQIADALLSGHTACNPRCSRQYVRRYARIRSSPYDCQCACRGWTAGPRRPHLVWRYVIRRTCH